MSYFTANLNRRKASALRPYLYSATRPVFSFLTALLIYLGGVFALSLLLGAYFGDVTAAADLFSRPYWGLIAMWLGACSWWGERQNWQRFVANDVTEMMLGPLEETGEKK